MEDELIKKYEKHIQQLEELNKRYEATLQEKENVNEPVEHIENNKIFKDRMLEFAQFFVDEEKKTLQAKHDEDLLKIGKLEAEKKFIENNLQALLEKQSLLEKKLADLAKELAEKKDENQKLISDNQRLYSIKTNLERELYDKNEVIRILNS